MKIWLLYVYDEDSIIHKISKEDVTVYSENDIPANAEKYDLWFGKWRKE